MDPTASSEVSVSKSSRWDVVARKSVQKKNDRGDTIVIALEGTSQERPLCDEDFIKISPFLKSVQRATFPANAYLPVFYREATHIIGRL
jgi:hypothetical protein